ncbi:hypothetical protein [Occallatibacter savannae]|uniref:hypothetical protein n=1 Tax=Occallatibacter savannae TaxID=1002691 RepID=UPI000D69F07E|nr:hypothetical protein [Occallatibacter savannae]
MKANPRKHHALLAAAIVLTSISALAQQSTRASVDDSAVRTARPSLGPSFNALTPSSGAAPGLNRSAPRPSPRRRTPITEAELLSGVNLTEQQKTAIDRIHHEMRAKMEIVSKDQNESPEQKSAMLEGMNRMQMRQVFDVLSSEQREEVRKRILAVRSTAHQDEKSSSPQSPR